MSKKTFKNKKNDEWEFDETPEVRAAIAKLHEDIRQRNITTTNRNNCRFTDALLHHNTETH